MGKISANTVKDTAKMIDLNMRYLQNMLERGAESNYNVYHYKGNPHKEATYTSIHHQIVTLRNMLLELDKEVLSVHNTY